MGGLEAVSSKGTENDRILLKRQQRTTMRKMGMRKASMVSCCSGRFDRILEILLETTTWVKECKIGNPTLSPFRKGLGNLGYYKSHPFVWSFTWCWSWVFRRVEISSLVTFKCLESMVKFNLPLLKRIIQDWQINCGDLCQIRPLE